LIKLLNVKILRLRLIRYLRTVSELIHDRFSRRFLVWVAVISTWCYFKVGLSQDLGKGCSRRSTLLHWVILLRLISRVYGPLLSTFATERRHRFILRCWIQIVSDWKTLNWQWSWYLTLRWLHIVLLHFVIF
jgi:hypothetical protein